MVRRGPEFVAAGGVPLPLHTGRGTGFRWGAGGVWSEPYNPARAAEVVEQLRLNWMAPGQKRGRGRGAGGAGGGASQPASPTGGLHRPPSPATSGSDSDSDGGGGGGGGGGGRGVNHVCEHAACAKQPACFVAELLKVRKQYLAGREGDFKKKVRGCVTDLLDGCVLCSCDRFAMCKGM